MADRGPAASSAPTKEWDANSYDRVATPQEEWALPVLERLDLNGDETVLDAGCGSGRVTALLLERLPRGRVIGVDASAAMLAKARERFAEEPRFEGICTDLLELDLDQVADVAFSNATFHWVLDHEDLFRRLLHALRPGARLVAQCGGEGNIDELIKIASTVATEEPYAAHFADWPQPWLFAGPGETEVRLRDAGFAEVRAWLEPRPTDLDPEQSREFISTVCLRLQIDHLPEELRGPYLDAVISRMKDPHHVGYVRLNFEGRRP